MRKFRVIDAVMDAIGSRDEITQDELRSVVFSIYSEPELMRRGSYYYGKKTRLTSAYAEGDWIDEASKAALVKLGIQKVISDLRRRGKSYLVFNKERGTVSRVRK